MAQQLIESQELPNDCWPDVTCQKMEMNKRQDSIGVKYVQHHNPGAVIGFLAWDYY